MRRLAARFQLIGISEIDTHAIRHRDIGESACVNTLFHAKSHYRNVALVSDSVHVSALIMSDAFKATLAILAFVALWVFVPPLILGAVFLALLAILGIAVLVAWWVDRNV